MKNYLRILIVCIIPLSITPQLNAQVNYYISATMGNNSNDGSFNAPWQTIQHALFNIPFSEDNVIIHLRAGTYVLSDGLYISGARGGSAGNYFTLQAYEDNGTPETVTLDGSALIPGASFLTISNTSYVRVQNLTFANYAGNYGKGIYVHDGSDYVEILNNTITDLHWSTSGNLPTSNDNLNGIVIVGDNATDISTQIMVLGNHLYNLTTGYSEALTITGNVDGFVIADNQVNDISNIGIVAAGNYPWVGIPDNLNHARNGTIRNNTVYNCASPIAIAAGIYLDGAVNVTVENNSSYANQVGLSVGCEQEGSSTGHILRNNLVYNNADAGIYLGSVGGNRLVQDISVSGNTFFKNFSAGGFGGEIVLQEIDQVTMRNNIFWARATVVMIASQTVTAADFDYNLYYNANGNGGNQATFDWSVPEGNTAFYTSFTAYQTGTGFDTNSIFIDPQFVNTNLPAPDLHLTTGSPAFDGGDPATLTTGQTDMDGQSRTMFTAVDIGADEAAMILPVEYLQPLQATTKANGILLTWATANEINTDHFVLQHSSDGHSWQAINHQASHRSGSTYSYLDLHPQAGINYYRLLQVDQDQTSSYSNLINIVWQGKATSSFVVYPNPSSGTVNLQGNLEKIDYLILFDEHGKWLPTTPNTLTQSLPQGQYWLHIVTKSQEKITLPFLIFEK